MALVRFLSLALRLGFRHFGGNGVLLRLANGGLNMKISRSIDWIWADYKNGWLNVSRQWSLDVFFQLLLFLSVNSNLALGRCSMQCESGNQLMHRLWRYFYTSLEIFLHLLSATSVTPGWFPIWSTTLAPKTFNDPKNVCGNAREMSTYCVTLSQRIWG